MTFANKNARSGSTLAPIGLKNLGKIYHDENTKDCYIFDRKKKEVPPNVTKFHFHTVLKLKPCL